MDNDGDGTLRKDQVYDFAQLVAKRTKQVRRRESVMNEFQKLDYNDDKKVSWDEIAEMGMN